METSAAKCGDFTSKLVIMYSNCVSFLDNGITIYNDSVETNVSVSLSNHIVIGLRDILNSLTSRDNHVSMIMFDVGCGRFNTYPGFLLRCLQSVAYNPRIAVVAV